MIKVNKTVRKLGDSKVLTLPPEFEGIEVGTVFCMKQEGHVITMVPLVPLVEMKEPITIKG